MHYGAWLRCKAEVVRLLSQAEIQWEMRQCFAKSSLKIYFWMAFDGKHLDVKDVGWRYRCDRPADWPCWHFSPSCTVFHYSHFKTPSLGSAQCFPVFSCYFGHKRKPTCLRSGPATQRGGSGTDLNTRSFICTTADRRPPTRACRVLHCQQITLNAVDTANRGGWCKKIKK